MTNTKKNRLAANKSNSESTSGSGHELKLIVTEGLSVSIRPNPQHEFLMSTKEAALGYGTSKYAIQKAFHRNAAELVEGKHFVTARTFCPHDKALPHNAVLWTKRGVVRLGFFIKSPNAKLFRDWAEDLIIEKMDASTGRATVPVTKDLNGTRAYNGNRLTKERLIDILQDVCLIDNNELRKTIAAKLRGGANG